MPPMTFRDIRTGKTVTVANPRRAMRMRLRADRYQEITEAPAVPDGTVAEVLEWAGDDPDRRAAALAAEKAGKKRKGILDGLA